MNDAGIVFPSELLCANLRSLIGSNLQSGIRAASLQESANLDNNHNNNTYNNNNDKNNTNTNNNTNEQKNNTILVMMILIIIILIIIIVKIKYITCTTRPKTYKHSK